jgi:HD-GYP domain-containing protein (c-di-GMP phosphodiesterase class II)
MASYNINLHETVYSLSDALDLVGVTHIHHGKRVAYMATECGKYLGWKRQRLDDLFQAGILHDTGVSKTSVHARLAQLEWEQDAEHCIVGSELLSSSPLLRHLAPIVLYHHTHWSVLREMDLPPEVKLSANCIYLADRADMLALKYLAAETDILLGMNEIRNTLESKRNDWFSPQLLDAFMDISSSEAFWFALEANRVEGYVTTWLAETTGKSMSFEELRGLVRIFSSIVDAKSSFTREHSDGVASLARYLGTLYGLPEEKCEMLELAGLLHDLGKLRVPDELLEKPGRLTDSENIIMRRHSFDTYSVLKNIRGLEHATTWAAQHHERVDGSGYPYHVKKTSLSLEARIVEVADVFQALAQRRPYRDSLAPANILEILKQQAASGQLDADVVAKVEAHLDECWHAAMRTPGEASK